MFGKVNPSRTEAALKGFNKKLDAVDELFEAPNYPILSLAIIFIFQIILLPSLMKKTLMKPKL